METVYGVGCLSISGTRGSGKTTLAKALLRERRIRRRLILDPLDDYSAEAYYTARTKEQVAAYMEELESVYGPEDTGHEFSLRYIPDDVSEAEAAAYLCEWAEYKTNLVLLIEEIHDSGSNRADPQVLTRLAKRGRHYNVDLWTSGQRPSDIAPGLRAELNANEWWVLRHAEWIDLGIFEKRRGPEFAARVASLPQLRALRVTPLEQEPEEYEIFYSPYPLIRKVGS